jgi:DNA-binding IclR family transcriptional regulator
VRCEESNEPVTLNVRVGAVMSMTTSVTGRLFAAFMPREWVKEPIGKELALLRKREQNLPMDLSAFKSLRKDSRGLRQSSRWNIAIQHQCLERASFRQRVADSRGHHRAWAARTV